MTELSKKEIVDKANKLYDEIDYNNFPEIETEDKDIPYSKGHFVTSPLINFLKDYEYYDSHASGYDDFGILNKTIFDIPSGSYICIHTLNSTEFKISWIVENVDDVIHQLLFDVDYDWRIFDKLGFTTKTKKIKLNFELSDEKLDNYVSSGI